MQPVPLYYVWDYTDVDRAFWAEHLEGWLPRADHSTPTRTSPTPPTAWRR